MSANQIKPSSLLAPGKEGDSNPQLTMNTANDNTSAIPFIGSTTNLNPRREISVEVSQNNKPVPISINRRSSMMRLVKKNEMEKLWKIKERRYKWEEFTFATYAMLYLGHVFCLRWFANLERKLKKEGYYIWAWGKEEDKRDWLTWDFILVSLLQAWFYLPEKYQALLHINEEARVICVSTPKHADRFASLFQNPHSALLGAKISDVEKGIQTPVGALKLPPITTTQVAPPVPASPEVAS